MTHVEYVIDVVHLHIEWYKSGPLQHHIENIPSLIPEPRSTPSSTPILVISNSLVLVCNY